MERFRPYTHILPQEEKKKLPLLISIPHCGVAFPENLKEQFLEKTLQRPEDTDWFLNSLYSFAIDEGIGLFYGNYSRYVVDLNRPLDEKPLYTDGRLSTGLFPSTDFHKNPIYAAEKKLPLTKEEKQKRLSSYYYPYHAALNSRLQELRKVFPHVLLWEAHSIKRYLPYIHPKPIADLTLSDGKGKTAEKSIIHSCLEELKKTKYSIAHNEPFQGGYSTRYYGDPSNGVHALQLEMSQDIYMKENKREVIPESFFSLEEDLKTILINLAKTVEEME